jgi:diguanylate cyclase (GGDEF)-like protein
MHRRLPILFATLLVAAAAFALEPSRRVDLYPIDVWRDGLPQYTIQAIEQDRNGYLWLGTFEGLVRFNGLRFDVFDEQRVPGLGTSQIRALRLDRDGVLWIGTTGAGLLQVRNGVPVPFRGSRPLPNGNVSSLLAARDGSMWVTTRSGVARIRGSRVEVWGVSEGLPHENALAAIEDAHGVIHVGTDGGLARFDGRRFQLEPLGTGPQPRVMSLATAADGGLWIGTLTDGLIRLAGNEQTHYGGTQGLPSGSIGAMTVDRDGSLWLGFAPGGLARLRDGRIELLGQPHGLPNDSVRALFEDREGSLWIGTNGGIARLKDLKFVSYSRRNGLAEDNVRVVTQTGDGSIWVGTYGGGVNRIRDGAITTFGTREGVGDLFIRTLAAEADGTVWAGTGNGLYAIRGTGAETVGAEMGLEGEKIQALLVRRDGTLLVVTESGGLQVRRHGRFSPLIVDGERFRTARVLLEDRRGGLWIGTSDRGLFLVEQGRIVQQWMTAEGLPGKAVYALHEGSDGTLWIGARGGLSRMRGRRIATVRMGNVFQVIDDGKGHFWLTSNRGLTRVSIASVHAVMDGRAERVDAATFTRSDGLASDQCNGATQPAGIRLESGMLAIPTVNGLTLVDPGHLHPNRVAPPVLLTDFLVDGRRIAHAPAAELPWDSTRFEFRFDGLSLLMPELVDFRYRLEGFDSQWVDSKRRRFAMYNSLPPGRYTFHVQARNNDGIPSTGTARLTFVLPAAPWRRWWAIAGYIAAALLAVVALVRVRERALVQRTLLLEQRVQQRTAELDAANRRLEALSMTDALTGVANRRSFDAALAAEWDRAFRSGAPLSLILVDVDHFKAYNDTYGHQGGDDCLRDVAAAMQQVMTRATDLIARYGGEEFAVLLPGSTAAEANVNAERLRRAVEAAALPHRSSSAADIVTISVGAATVTPAAGSAQPNLIRAADEALYRAKREGRNRVVTVAA